MTDQTRISQLDRLYVSLTTANEGQTPTLQVMGRTPNVKPEHLAECWRLARILPPPVAQRSDKMPGSFGIFRGETVDFIIATAQTSANGTPYFQYLLAPSAAIRAIAGQVTIFEQQIKEPLPQFATQRTDLPSMSFDLPDVTNRDTQTESLLALMDYCKNNLKVVNGLLAGLVQAMSIAVIKAPSSAHDRLAFIQGLLTLLPIPARVAITFATSVLDGVQTNTQIKFMANDTRPEGHLIYDWAAGKLLTDAPDDVYAKYIMAQLRLDTSLVLDQTEKLARTAVWRAMRKDDMANALAWVSRRASLDSAVQDGLPADRKMVAAVLREDPTLPDDLRVSYTNHLLKFALALDDPSDTDIIPTMANTNRELADTVYEQLRAATETDRAAAVYNIVSRWITQPPLGIDINRWQPLLSMAAIAQTARLLLGPDEPLIRFFEQFLESPLATQMEQPLMQMVAVTRKRAHDNQQLAKVIGLITMRYFPSTAVQRIFSETPFIAQLPEALRIAVPHMSEVRVNPAPPAMLVKAADAFGSENQAVVLVRLVEWALFLQRYDLIDVDTLRGMIKASTVPAARHFNSVFLFIIESMSPPNILKTLDSKTPQYLIELSIVTGQFVDAVRQIELYQSTLYKGTPLEDMSAILRAIFREVPAPIQTVGQAHDAIQQSAEIKLIARAAGYIGTLENKNWGPEAEFAARKLTAILFADPRLTDVIGVEIALRLLKANVDRKDAVESLRLATSLVEYALIMGSDKGPTLIQQIYPMLTWSPEVADAATELLRTYIRRAPKEYADKLPDLLGSRYGDEVRRTINAAYRVRLMVGGDLMQFADEVQVGTQLLTDILLTYAPNREVPPIFKLRRTVEGMPGGLSESERDRLSWNLNTIGLQILQLVTIAKSRKGRTENEAFRTQLLKNQLAPTTGIDALHWLGGRFAESKPYNFVQEREALAFMFGSRSVNMLLRETDLLTKLLGGLINAFPENEPVPVDGQTWTTEVNTVWGQLSLYNQRQIQETLSHDTQLLAQIVTAIGAKSNERIFQPSGSGKQLQIGKSQPASAAEALRWVSGYFGQQHT